MIDAALAFTGHGVILGFKAGTTSQHFEIAWAPTIGGTFHLVGQPDIKIYNDTVENYEFLTTGGTWRLVATSIPSTNPSLSPWVPEIPRHRQPGSTGSAAANSCYPPSPSIRAAESRASISNTPIPGVSLRWAPGRGLPDLRREHRFSKLRRMGPRPCRHRTESRPDQLASAALSDVIWLDRSHDGIV